MSPSERVAQNREAIRARNIGPRYRGWAHFAFTSAGSLGAIAFALLQLDRVHPVEWLTVPVAFLVANAAEYLGHRHPMHVRTRGLRLLFRRHTEEHHRFFTHLEMAYESSRDFKLVLFPPVMLLFFLGGIAAPLTALCFVVFSANVGWLFCATAVGYYLTYEWLHFAYHLPAAHPLSRLGALAALRRHHTRHHDPSRMGQIHFNITFPICDRLFGTLERSRPRATTGAGAGGSDEQHGTGLEPPGPEAPEIGRNQG